MEPIKDFDKVKASGMYDRLPAGGYVVEITGIKNDAPKSYLLITYDIAEGEYAGHFKDLDAKYIFAHQFTRSYKDTALGMFKGFIKSVEESNPGFVWDWDENKLVGKIVGIILGEEEYENNRGEIKTGLKVNSCRPVEVIRSGMFKIPEPKKMERTNDLDGFTPLNDDDIPFA